MYQNEGHELHQISCMKNKITNLILSTNQIFRAETCSSVKKQNQFITLVQIKKCNIWYLIINT